MAKRINFKIKESVQEIKQFRKKNKSVYIKSVGCFGLHSYTNLAFKSRYKNQQFKTMQYLKDWLHNFVKSMTKKQIISITGNHHYKKAFYT